MTQSASTPIATRTAAAVLLPLIVATAGCLTCTERLRNAGLRHEIPAPAKPAAPAGPLVAAYTDAKGSRVAVQYTALRRWEATDPVKHVKRWVNVDIAKVLNSMPPEFPDRECRNERVSYSTLGGDHFYRLSDEFVRRNTSRRPRWRLRKMRQMNVQFMTPLDPARRPACIGLAPLGRSWPGNVEISLIFNAPETPGRDIVVFRFADREYRTWWGHAAQVFLPAAVACDVTTGAVILVCFICSPIDTVSGFFSGPPPKHPPQD